MSSSTAGQSAGQLETRGIEPVPEGECNGHPLQLFWVWFEIGRASCRERV